MSLFLNTSSLHNHYLDCCAIDVSETIERDCLSVLHKLHDQVNGLQLVQVVVQPLARLFNPASLAALASNVSSSSFANATTTTTTTSNNNNNNNTIQSYPSNAAASGGGGGGASQDTASTPSTQHPPSIGGGGHLNHDLDIVSTSTSSATTTTIAATTTTAGASSLTTTGSVGYNGHSRGHSFQTSAFNTSTSSNNSSNNNNNDAGNQSNTSSNLLMSTTSTYMMSPDTAQALIARLDTDRDVNWLMEIIGYGLSMPFSLTGEQDSVKDCCTIYCEWLASALLPYNEFNEDSKYQQLSKLVPVPIRNDPNHYARKILSHLYNVFLPRQTINSSSSQKDHLDAQLTAVSRQAVLCHRVLRTIESIAQNPLNLMDKQTWDHLLALLLTVNDKLLSGPTEPDDIGTQLHDRILGVLFELIILASAKSIPTPGLWKTFHEMSLNWRHRPALVDHWRRITLLLTKRIVATSPVTALGRRDSESHILQNSNNNNNTSSSEVATSSAIEVAIASLNYENLSQTWYRFLNLIGNPVELSDPNIISRTDEFYHSACASDNVLDPRQHPCLNILPQVFMNSMVALRDFVDAFLGNYQQPPVEEQKPDLLTPDRPPPSYNQSARGSIVSLNSKISANFSTNHQPQHQQNQPQSQTQSHQQQQQQPQAVTPTQSRKTGIKSITMKGVMPFTSAAGLGPVPAPASPVDSTTTTGNEVHHVKSGSISSQRPQQFPHQPRPSLSGLITGGRAGQQQQQSPAPQFRLSPERPKCNSILHIFGDWLFSAALIGSDLNQETVESSAEGDCSTSVGSSSITTEVSGHRSFSPSLGLRRNANQKSASRQLQSGKQQDSLTGGGSSGDSQRIQLEPSLSADSFELGQAEAMAILCKIFSSKTAAEDILPTYLSRFYLCLQHCLTFGSGQDQRDPNLQSSSIKRQLLSSVLINSTTLLQKDLDGINLLIPTFIKAIEFVFECNERETPIQPPPRQHNRSGSIRNDGATAYNLANNYDLKRACISTLLNLLAYPFHFQELVIRNCLIDSSPTTTFGSLRPRLLKLLFIALQTETDPINMQILFGGLSLTIHDLASNACKTSGSKEERKKCRARNDLSGSGNDSSLNSLDGGGGNSNRRNDDNISQNSFVFNSNGGFLIKSLHVTCHLLINIWKHDTQVSLAALELLTTIARVSASSHLVDSSEQSSYGKNNNRLEMKNEYKQTTKWICDYICNQCSRPPPAHSRDMHSTIVAAYQCLSVWFYNHPYLLNDENCVYTLMEVIELGVSGQKSKTTTVNPSTGIATQQVVSKSEKIMKPSSMRVREAAESLLNICMVRASTPVDDLGKLLSSYDTVLDELSVAELFAGSQQSRVGNLSKQVSDLESKRNDIYKQFKFFSDEDSIIFGLLEGTNHDPMTKDSVVCLLRTPFGKHCWKIKFNYYTEKSRDKIIANKTLGLIKRPFQQCTTPTTEMRMFSFPGSHSNKSLLYFNNSARFFPTTLDDLPQNELDHLVTALDDYMVTPIKDSRLKNDLDKISKIYAHQVLAEQKVMSESTIRIKRVDCEEPQPMNDLEAARIIVTHLGWRTALSPLQTKGDKILPQFVSDLKSLDHQSVRTCDWVSIFYVRKNRTSPKEILESVRERHNVSLSFFEWILELGQPTVVKYHSRWTGKVSNSWNRNVLTLSDSPDDCKVSLSRNQMLTSDHGGAIFDGDRMTIYWSDMCQELAFLVPHKIEKAAPPPSYPASSTPYDTHGQANTKSHPPSECELMIGNQQHRGSIHSAASHDMNEQQHHHPHGRGKDGGHLDHNNSDGQSLSSVASEASSHSTRARSQQSGSPQAANSSSSTSGHNQRDQKDNVSLSRQSVTTTATAQKRKSTISSTIIGCDTNIIICWLECQDDMQDVPCESLLTIAETGYLYEDPNQQQQQQQDHQHHHLHHQQQHPQQQTQPVRKSRMRDSVKYFISPMKNGLYRINLTTSFGRHWLALPLVDGMTVSKGILSSLIRESVLNLCRRRRLDADSYQPPHVRRRIKLQDICNTYKISSRYESTEFYNNLFKSKGAT